MNEFGSIVERHRRELLVHCYCMLGSLPDAEDAVQETLLCAWRYRDSLKEGAPLRPGLYSVATNTCLDAIGRDEGWAGEPDDVVWLGPTPDSVLEPLIPPARTPETITLMRETIEIALLRLTTCGSLELSSHPARKEALDRSRALGLWLRNWLPQACSSAKSSWKACLPASGLRRMNGFGRASLLSMLRPQQ